MARPRRQSPHLLIARRYIEQHIPELRGVPLRVRMLDGPPGSPRYVVTAEHCTATECPFAVDPGEAAAGHCEIPACQLRHSVRLLLNRSGEVIQVTRSDLHWR